MTGSNFASLVREYTRTNSTTLTDALIVLFGNTVKDDFAKEIIKADEDLFGFYALRNLIASTTTITSREYNLPDYLLRLKRVEAALDGTNFIPLYEFDLNRHKKPTDEDAIQRYFANEDGKAFYEIFRRSLWIYSGAITAGTNTMKLWGIMYPADITAGTLADATNDLSKDPTTTSVQLPRQFHELWARKVSIIWKSTREKPIPLSERELKFDVDFASAIDSITNSNLDRNNVASTPDDSHLQV